MEDRSTEGGKRFIREQIVPGKNYRKVIVRILAAIGLGILFGLSAAVTIALTEKLTEEEPETKREQIIIVRDDTSSETESVPTTEAPATTEQAEAESGAAEVPSEETEASEKSAAGAVTEQELLRKAYGILEKGLATITVTKAGGTDWFDSEIISRTEQFGVLIAKSYTTLFYLTEGGELAAGDEVGVEFRGEKVQGIVYGVDSRTGLAVVTVRNGLFSETPEAAALGNSFAVQTMDRVFLAGQPFHVTGAVESGMVTNVLSSVDIVDGYEQLLFTDLSREEGGTGVLFNTEGEILGWVSDYMNEYYSGIAVACGISPLKYLIEDLCSGDPTAFLGVTCSYVSRAAAEEAGIISGLYVQAVENGSPAYENGIQIGDRLISLNGRTLSDSHSLRLRLDDLTSGERTLVEVGRGNGDGEKTLNLWVDLGSR